MKMGLRNILMVSKQRTKKDYPYLYPGYLHHIVSECLKNLSIIVQHFLHSNELGFSFPQVFLSLDHMKKKTNFLLVQNRFFSKFENWKRNHNKYVLNCRFGICCLVVWSHELVMHTKPIIVFYQTSKVDRT